MSSSTLDIESGAQLLSGQQSCSIDIVYTLLFATLRGIEKRSKHRKTQLDATTPSLCEKPNAGLLSSPKVVDVLSGASARIASQALIYPLDTLKTRMQVSATGIKLASSATGIKLASSGGSLLTGFSGSMATFIPSAMVYFGVNTLCKEVLKQRRKKSGHGDDTAPLSRVSNLIASTASAFSSSFFRVPSDAYVYPSVANAASQIMRTKGLRGMYAGFGATLMRDVPELALQFFLYEEFLKIFCPATSSEGGAAAAKASPQRHLLLGGSAGAAAAMLTNPLDVIKTNMQSGGASSFNGALRMVLQKRGVLGLWCGSGPRVAMTTLQCATFFCLYEEGGCPDARANIPASISSSLDPGIRSRRAPTAILSSPILPSGGRTSHGHHGFGLTIGAAATMNLVVVHFPVLISMLAFGGALIQGYAVMDIMDLASPLVLQLQ
eukprot:gene28697-31861_t